MEETEKADLYKDNLAYWNDIAPVHMASSFYRTEDFRKGEMVLDEVARAAAGDVAGRRLLHLQCHFGLDTLSLARLGAIATGLDYAPAAVDAARKLSRQTGVRADFVLADVLQPPAELKGFDIVFASWGAICWHRDIGRWMQVAADALKPGGRLCLVEGHPAMLMLDDKGKAGERLKVGFDYDSPDPITSEGFEDYAEPGARAGTGRTFSWNHGLGRILNAAIEAGFVIRRLDEGDRVPWKALPQLVPNGAGYWTLPASSPLVPLNFTLDADLG
jgi:SAM-dependent methyltransferase